MAIVVILTSGVLYPFIGGFRLSSTGDPYRLFLTDPVSLDSILGSIPILAHGLYFSIIMFTTIGYGDLYPTRPLSKALDGFESLMGGLLIAVFVYVLVRRVAR